MLTIESDQFLNYALVQHMSLNMCKNNLNLRESCTLELNINYPEFGRYHHKF